MIDRLDEEKRVAFMANLKIGTKISLAEVAQTWHRTKVEGMPARVSLIDLRDQYSNLMHDVLTFPEEDRLDLLKAYSRGMRLKEGRTTITQKIYSNSIFGIRDRIAPERLHLVRHLLYPVLQKGIANGFTYEMMLYTTSHFDLGVNCGYPFGEITQDMKNYLLNLENKPELVDENGMINLETIMRIHSKVLVSPEEAVGDVEEQMPLYEEYDEEPQNEEGNEDYEDDPRERFQKFRRAKKSILSVNN